jgi:hypothetical protein
MEGLIEQLLNAMRHKRSTKGEDLRFLYLSTAFPHYVAGSRKALINAASSTGGCNTI